MKRSHIPIRATFPVADQAAHAPAIEPVELKKRRHVSKACNSCRKRRIRVRLSQAEESFNACACTEKLPFTISGLIPDSAMDNNLPALIARTRLFVAYIETMSNCRPSRKRLSLISFGCSTAFLLHRPSTSFPAFPRNQTHITRY